MVLSGTVEPRYRQLILLGIALVLGMATWFSTAAVLGQLRAAWDLSDGQAAWLTIVVQLGFVAGALVSSSLNLADRIAPLRFIAIGTTGAGLANAVLVVAGGFEPGLVLRFLTGAFLAGVYPPALKAMSSWFREGRGLALGVMIGALTIGSALPHLVNAVGGLDWRVTMMIASALTLTGGFVAWAFCREGPYAAGAAGFDPTQVDRKSVV